jgi:hypothetical protein
MTRSDCLRDYEPEVYNVKTWKGSGVWFNVWHVLGSLQAVIVQCELDAGTKLRV